MKSKIMVGILFCMLTSPVVFADKFPSKLSTSDELFWGIFNTAYPNDSRIIISDTGMTYDAYTKFKSSDGTLIAHPEMDIKPGTPVEYHVEVLPDSFKLIDMQTISKEQYQTLNDEQED